MKYIVFLPIILLIACSNSVEIENKQETREVSDKKSDNSETASFASLRFDIYEYKRKIDSLISEVVGEKIQTKMTFDTLKNGEIIFVELKNTQLSDLADSHVLKYNFTLTSDKSSLKHHLIVLTYKDVSMADSVFSVFKKVALENSGVPGLTYSSDYILKISNEICWINSSCSLSYNNHLKFVEVFKKLKHVSETEALQCKCGKVQCIISKNSKV